MKAKRITLCKYRFICRKTPRIKAGDSDGRKSRRHSAGTSSTPPSKQKLKPSLPATSEKPEQE